MNRDKIDVLLMESGCRFEFLHGKDYEDFSPYKFAGLLAQDAISVVQSFRCKMDASNDNIVEALKQHFGVE